MAATHDRVEAPPQRAVDARPWLLSGGAAGLMLVAVMLVLRALTGAPSLPEQIQDEALALVPAPVFSWVLDRLQLWAKPLLLVGLTFLPVPVGAGLGWVYGRAWPQQGWLARGRVLGGLAFGLALWAVVELALFASEDGATQPLTSAISLLVSFAAFGLSLVGFRRLLNPLTDGAAVDPRRRAVVLGGLIGGAFVLSSAGLARLLALNSEQTTLEGSPPEASAATPTAPQATPAIGAGTNPPAAATNVEIPSGVAEEITPNDRFYVVSKNFNDPRVPAETWSLDISGLVDQPQRITYEQILTLATESHYATLECVSNTLGGKEMSNARWTGVPFSQLLANVGVQPEARAVVIRSADNYYESFPLEQLRAPGVLLAHAMNGTPLPDKHGFPLRLILPGPYGMKNPKWIVKIELVSDRIDGYWVRRGWDREAPVQTVARIDTPRDNAVIDGPRLEVGGVAFAGTRGVGGVQASLDGGATWRDARTRPPLGPSTWVQWVVDWDDAAPGRYTVLARAADRSGDFQTADEHDPLPRGATGYHHATFDLRA